MAVTPPLSQTDEMAFSKIAQDTIKGGGLLTQTAFMNNAKAQGLTTNPLSNRIWANALSEYKKSSPVTTTEDVQKEVDQTDKTINDYDANKEAQQQKKNAQSLFNQQNFNEKINETTSEYDQFIDSELKNTQDTFDALYAERGSATDTLIQSLKDQYALFAEEQKTINKAGLNQKKTSLSRSGASRYANEQASGIITQEQTAGLNRIKALAAEEAQLIAEAKIAKTEDQWKMFNEKRAALTELQGKKVTALKDQLTMLTQSNTLAESEASAALEKLSLAAQSGTAIDPQLASQLDSAYGQGFSQNYSNLIQRTQAVTEETDKVALAQDVMDLLNTIPEGQEIEIGGNIYTGLYSPEPNVRVYQERDANNQIQIIKYNEDTNEITVTSTGVTSGVGLGGGSGDPNLVPAETFEEWLEKKQTSEQFTYSAGEYPQLREQYNKEVEYVSDVPLTNTEIKDLEAAGLLNATRQEQIQFLRGEKIKDVTDRYTTAQQTKLRAKYGQDWKEGIEKNTISLEDVDKFLSGDEDDEW